MLNKKTSILVALVLLIAAVYLLAFKKKGDIKPDDKKPDGDKKPAAEESDYLLTGLKCNCKDEAGNIYRGDELLLGDGSRVCLCPDYFAVYGYPHWWGGYYGWRYPGRRWGGHRPRQGWHRYRPAPAPAAPAPVRVSPVGGGMRMGGAPMGGGMRGGGGRGR